MARLSNLYGSAPVAQASRRGGGGGSRPKNRNQAGGGGGGGGKQPGSGGLYGGNAGEALTNQDPEQYIQDLLNNIGAFDSSGTAYGTWKNDTMAAKLLADYQVAQDAQQNLNPADYFKNQYGAGFYNAGGKHGQGKDFQGGTLGGIVGPTADQYTDFQSNTDPRAYLAGKFQQGGLTMPGGGNADFDRYLQDVFSPKLQANLEAARAAGAVSPDGSLVTTPGSPGGNGNTLPIGDGGDFGGDPMRRRQWLRDQGMHRLNQMNPNARKNAKGQYQDYVGGFNNTSTPGTGGGAATTTPGTTPISLNDFVAQQNLVDQARQMYAFRSNAERQPGPIALAGRYSWWG